MQNISNIDFENIKRMKEIAKIYKITNQNSKCEKYHKIIIDICDKHPQDEKALAEKIHSLNQIDNSYKSLKATKELLSLNPYNIYGIKNLIDYINW